MQNKPKLPEKLTDPVSGYQYPPEWIEKCPEPESLHLITSGLGVLASDGSVRRRGYTTGSTAAASVKAAILSLKDPLITEISIPTPVGIRLTIPVSAKDGEAAVSKYSGDYPGDVTEGIIIKASATSSDSPEILFGEGIGIWQRNTQRFSKGSPAVSETAYKQIQDAFEEGCLETGIDTLKVTLFIPKGREIAQKTLNEKIGVTGGISLLGSTGFVEPWDDHLQETVLERATNAKKVVLTTGRVGLKFSRLLFPDYEVILAGSKINTILPHLTGEVIICGLPALILKYANPDFLRGSKYRTVEEMTGAEEFEIRMNDTLSNYAMHHPEVRIILINRQGMIVGETP